MGTKNGVLAVALGLCVALAGWGAARLSAGEKGGGSDQEGFAPLFGTPTWLIHKGKTNTWAFSDDGTIFTLRGGGGWLMTRKEYADFDLRLQIKMSKGADTGVAIRSSLDVDPSIGGTQVQFVDEDKSREWPKADRTGGIWDVVGPSKENLTRPVGEWNDLQIVARGSRVKVTINGEATLDVDLDRYKERVTGKGAGQHAHPDLLRGKGHIGLQSWDGRVEFRNLRIKELK
jgi:3-keto-disaccharide hydrolase